MTTRAELKERGKAAFKSNYWNCVIAALVLAMISGGEIASHRNQIRGSGVETNMHFQRIYPVIAGLLPLIFLIIGMSYVVFKMLDIFLFNALVVGGHRFFLINRTYPAKLGEIGIAFESNYINIVKTMFFNDLFISLWTLLFVIPGIVKSYSYRMVPFIMAEDPNTDSMRAITLSRQMMDGHKLDAFILDLSFIGWHLLSAITVGIFGIFYTNPYVNATNAELYAELRDKLMVSNYSNYS